MSRRVSLTESNSSSASQSESQNNSSTQGSSTSSSQSSTQGTQTSQTSHVLDSGLLEQIMSGLTGDMTDEEISEYVTNLLKPKLNAEIEASQQNYETTKLSKEQEIENLAVALAQAIAGQEQSYQKSMANVETAALSRGMGRSSYTMESLSNQGKALADAIKSLTDENTRQSGQIQSQITQAAQQNSQTQGRLNTDYAANVAATVQQIRQEQANRHDSNYMTAVSGSMGSTTTGTSTSNSTGTQTGTSNSTTTGTSTSNTNQQTSGTSQAGDVDVPDYVGSVPASGSGDTGTTTTPTKKPTTSGSSFNTTVKN